MSRVNDGHLKWTNLALGSVAVKAGLCSPVPTSVKVMSKIIVSVICETYLLRWSISMPRSKSMISPLN